MSRFFFHIYDGEEYIDEHGTALISREEARTHAIIIAGELLKDAGRNFWSGTKWRLRVTDETGTNICTLKFSVEDEDLSQT
jgi:hypothetical protein